MRRREREVLVSGVYGDGDEVGFTHSLMNPPEEALEVSH